MTTMLLCTCSNVEIDRIVSRLLTDTFARVWAGGATALGVGYSAHSPLSNKPHNVRSLSVTHRWQVERLEPRSQLLYLLWVATAN